MSTKMFLAIMVVVLSIASYVAYTKLTEGDNNTPLEQDGISFICSNNTYFVAEFNPDFSEVNIVIDGVVKQNLDRVTADIPIHRYRSGDFTYTFAGEEVNVRDDATQTTIVCNQPFDPNRAPHNFGDLGEGGGESNDLYTATRNSIRGIWQSVDDQKFVREFADDGTAFDKYEGEEDVIGTFEVFESNTGVETPFEQEDSTVYLKMTMGEMADEIFYFKIGKITPEELELIYLDRGGVLRFMKIMPN